MRSIIDDLGDLPEVRSRKVARDIVDELKARGWTFTHAEEQIILNHPWPVPKTTDETIKTSITRWQTL